MYKSGDIVLFRNDLEVNMPYGDITWLNEMDEHHLGKGEIIDYFDESDGTFTLCDDVNGYWYSVEMLRW